MVSDLETMKAPPLLGPAENGRVLTSDEFAEADFDRRWRYERVEWRLVVMAPGGEEHSRNQESWLERLFVYKVGHRDVVAHIRPESWIRVDQGTDRIPDIAVYLTGVGPSPKIPDRVPELVFEIVSPGRTVRDRDYLLKREHYHRLGLLEYVIIDRFSQTVTVLAHAPEGYRERTLSIGQAYESSHLPGLVIPLSEVF